MKDRDNIPDIYRKRIGELVDDQAGPNPDIQLNQEEVDAIWDEISLELDISEVWNGISSGLDKVMPVNQGSGIIFKSIALALLLFTSLVLVRIAILDPVKSKTDKAVKNKFNERSPAWVNQNKAGDSKKGIREKAEIPRMIKSESDKNDNAGPAVQAAGKITDRQQSGAIPVPGKDLSSDLSVPERIQEYPDIMPDPVPVEEAMALPSLYPIDPVRAGGLSTGGQDELKIYGNTPGSLPAHPFNCGRRLSLGIITVFKNTWLLNQETRDGLKPETLTTTIIEYNYDVGLSLNYALNPAWSIQSDGFFCSNTGQEYYEYIYGHYSRKQITLEYLSITLSAKHKLFGRGRLIRRPSVNLLAGGYVSLLQNASQKINKDLKSIGSHYDKLDYGVRLGAEIEFPLYKHVYLAPGLFMTLGLPDISRDGNSGPDSYRLNTRNGSAGFHLAFYFH